MNIRLSKSLLWDLGFIERCTGIRKNDWLRYKLAESVRKEKDSLLEQLHREYVRGHKDDAQFTALAGEPPQDLKIKKRLYTQKMIKLMKDVRHKKFAKKALLSIAKKVKKREGLL